MKTKLLFLISIIFLPQVAWASEYTRSYDFRPICIESKELLKSVTEIINYCRLNSGVPVAIEGHIRFGGDGRATELSLPIKTDTFENYPAIFYECDINIKAKDGLVSEVNLIFTDSLRRITVGGSDNIHVNELIKLTQEKLSHYEIDAAGPNFRIVFYLIAMIFYSIAVSSTWSVIRLEDEPIYWVIHFAFFFAFIFIPPWATVFPGFKAAAECRSFLERYGTLFAFLGCGIVLLGLILEVIRHIKKKETNNRK
jgi:hypothetical protein